jgi:hypothetical protein
MPIYEKYVSCLKQAEQIKELTLLLDKALKQNKKYRQQIGELQTALEILKNTVASQTFKDFGN